MKGKVSEPVRIQRRALIDGILRIKLKFGRDNFGGLVDLIGKVCNDANAQEILKIRNLSIPAGLGCQLAPGALFRFHAIIDAVVIYATVEQGPLKKTLQHIPKVPQALGNDTVV